ncbi:hypothetical protein [Streptomyces sp. NBC_01497]|uniref:hypothetical protein n=1 Tax=Streptomyces sp. NBC_01497 TaxID=2903885 RepID=UPI002E33B42B|nr:hypothetical protein [Streptomyces sp. NBC_01497]
MVFGVAAEKAGLVPRERRGEKSRVRGLGVAASVLALVGLAACGGGDQDKKQRDPDISGTATTLERACGGIFDPASVKALHKASVDTEKVYEERDPGEHADLVEALTSGDDQESVTVCSLEDGRGAQLVRMSFSASTWTRFPKGTTAQFSSLQGAFPAESLRIDCGMSGNAPSLDGLLSTGYRAIDLPVRRALLAHAGAKAAAAVHCPNHVVFPPVPTFVPG